jgi:ABC-2 type transport system permease protein
MNIAYLRTEIIRLIRNRRVLIFSMIMPGLLLLIIGGTNKNTHVGGIDVSAYIMVSMGLWGSMSAAIGSGGLIAVERGIGWNRQLRLTGLHPNAYVATKIALSLIMALPPILLTYVVGALALDVRMPAQTWVLIGALSWLGALPFAALGLVVGYLAKPDSVQQISALIYLLLALFGGIWIPVETMPSLMHHIAVWTPAYWVGQVARGPLFHTAFSMDSVGVVLLWTVVLGAIGLRRFRADTARA